MSQRDSGYERKERDLYETPEWVTLALVPHLRKGLVIHEPACASGKMVNALRMAGFTVTADDIDRGTDFLKTWERHEAIVTNPPYELAREFIEHALGRISVNNGLCAMLLRTDFDHAVTRKHLFGDQEYGCAPFAKKLVLTKRIQWFEDSTGSPSFNHAWFIWDWAHEGPPVLAYDFQRL